MKFAQPILILSLLALSACSTTKHHSKKDGKEDKPETVMITYHVRVGAETDFLPVLMHAWEIYRKEHIVFEEPHVVIRDIENGNKSKIVEIFTWVSHSAPNHAPQSVKDIWEKEHAFCEDRNGRGGIEGGEVELLLPVSK